MFSGPTTCPGTSLMGACLTDRHPSPSAPAHVTTSMPRLAACSICLSKSGRDSIFVQLLHRHILHKL